MPYNVMPFPKFFAVDVNGAPYAGGKLYAWQAGGLSVPQDTYADSTGTVNANPVVLDGSGRATVYLAPKAYAFELRDANDVQIWTQDPVYGFGLTEDNGINGGRLTLTTGVPVTTSDVTAATSIFFTPYQGSQIALFDGISVWGLFDFTEISIAVPATTSQMYDVFVSQSAGTCSLSLVAWTNDSTRATALSLQDGVLVKSGATTNRYLGSFRTTGVSGQTEDSYAKRFLWNYYHRVVRAMRVLEATNSWNWSTGSYQQANASPANQLAVVIGVAEVGVQVNINAFASSDTAGIGLRVAVGKDSATTPLSGSIQTNTLVPVINYIVAMQASVLDYPAAGYHFYAWLEHGNGSGTNTFYGDNNAPTLTQSGIAGWVMG